MLLQNVYMTKAEKKYHQERFNIMSSSSICIKSSEVINLMLRAYCGCAPPQETNKPTQKSNNPNTS